MEKLQKKVILPVNYVLNQLEENEKPMGEPCIEKLV